jgi:hypothetical protein
MPIVSVRDGSLVVIPELAYSPMTNFELCLRSPPLSAGREPNTVRSRTTTGSSFGFATI